MSTQINKWLVDAFRCATIQKDDKLEMEVFFINMEKKRLYEESLSP
jgi:hypothetical protein